MTMTVDGRHLFSARAKSAHRDVGQVVMSIRVSICAPLQGAFHHAVAFPAMFVEQGMNLGKGGNNYVRRNA